MYVDGSSATYGKMGWAKKQRVKPTRANKTAGLSLISNPHLPWYWGWCVAEVLGCSNKN
jgi:hypothetical protein